MGRYLGVAAVVVAVAAGSAFASSRGGGDATAATDRAVVRELRAVRQELRKLNANVGNRFGDEPVISQLTDIKRSTKYTCESVAQSSFTPC